MIINMEFFFRFFGTERVVPPHTYTQTPKSQCFISFSEQINSQPPTKREISDSLSPLLCWFFLAYYGWYPYTNRNWTNNRRARIKKTFEACRYRGKLKNTTTETSKNNSSHRSLFFLYFSAVFSLLFS